MWLRDPSSPGLMKAPGFAGRGAGCSRGSRALPLLSVLIPRQFEKGSVRGHGLRL